MRFSTIAIAAASGAAAAPLGLGNLGNLGDVSGLVEGLPLVGGLVAPLAGALNSAGGVGNALNIVFTITKDPTSALGGLTSLSVLNGGGNQLLASTCADKLVGDALSSIPVDFSKVNSDGVGKFVFNDIAYEVSETVKNAPAVSCVKQITQGLTAVRCVVPQVEGVALNAVEDVTGLANCFANKIPVAGPLVTDVESKIAALPLLNGLSGLTQLPGVSDLVGGLSL